MIEGLTDLEGFEAPTDGESDKALRAHQENIGVDASELARRTANEEKSKGVKPSDAANYEYNEAKERENVEARKRLLKARDEAASRGVGAPEKKEVKALDDIDEQIRRETLAGLKLNNQLTRLKIKAFNREPVDTNIEGE